MLLQLSLLMLELKFKRRESSALTDEEKKQMSKKGAEKNKLTMRHVKAV